ncbi:helix-turn-helix domain-containing protein [Amycolatopsis anabasis]|uniref:helix-turn-helix domain-containing protein n=1 Tax=Amycolatopsis anabasis TaxID=1840409 RepID=UPI00131E99BC|nr:helix-turn-helix domain-containing protein [Amycolatopsis anabasis]
MSWRIDADGTVETDEGDVFTSEPPHGRHALRLPDCYRPVIGGVRHRTEFRARPPAGEWVTALCGLLYQVTARPAADPIYECHACDEEAEEQAMAYQPETANPYTDQLDTLIGELIRMRRNRGLTQRDVAAYLGCDAPTICRLEKREREFTARALQGYACALGYRIVMVISPLG